jgi:hypothetical protein
MIRRTLALGTLASLLIVALPASVTAAPSQHVTEHAIVVQCDLSSDDGFVSTFMVDSSEFGTFGDLAFWQAPAEPFSGEPTLVTISAEVDGTDTSMSATFELIELSTGSPAGTAIFDAALTPNGSPVPVAERFRDGNRWTRIEGTVQPMDVSGTLTVPGAEAFDLAGCFAAIQDLTYFTTNPSAFVERFENFNLSCFWETTDGSVYLFAGGDAFGTFSDLFVADATGEYSGFSDAATLTETAFSGTYELFLQPDGDLAVGSGSASATLEPTGDVIRTVTRSGANLVKFTSEPLLVSGSLEFSTPGGDQTLPMDDEHCLASHDHVFVHDVRPSGPKPGPLANDTPEGAIAADLGRTLRVVTGGNAQAPEEPCSFVDPESGETFELPIEYTAWWTFVGTGGPVTVDSAGSDFDTIVGVYTGSPGSLTQVGCVDDVFDPDFSLQARITIDTVAGVTYYVQAGGFGGSTGRLQLVIQ